MQNKQQFIHKVFANIAPKYNVMNDLMTCGLHRIWKHKVCELLNLNANQTDLKLLDIATGTGDLPLILNKLYKNADITGIDTSQEMLNIAQDRLSQLISHNIKISQLDIFDAPEVLNINSYDGITISYGLRNTIDYEQCLKNIHTLLKSGGKLSILDMSYPNALMNILSAPYRYIIIPILGKLLLNDSSSYKYLTHSHKQYLTQTQLVKLLKKTGFHNIKYYNLLGGISCIHSADKL